MQRVPKLMGGAGLQRVLGARAVFCHSVELLRTPRLDCFAVQSASCVGGKVFFRLVAAPVEGLEGRCADVGPALFRQDLAGDEVLVLVEPR